MLIWTCRSCGRDFPAPRSGRDRCLACIVRERKHLRSAARASHEHGRRPGDMWMERLDRSERRGRDRRSMLDRRVVDIRVARERRMMADRRAGPERRDVAVASMR